MSLPTRRTSGNFNRIQANFSCSVVGAAPVVVVVVEFDVDVDKLWSVVYSPKALVIFSWTSSIKLDSVTPWTSKSKKNTYRSNKLLAYCFRQKKVRKRQNSLSLSRLFGLSFDSTSLIIYYYFVLPAWSDAWSMSCTRINQIKITFTQWYKNKRQALHHNFKRTWVKKNQIFQCQIFRILKKDEFNEIKWCF